MKKKILLTLTAMILGIFALGAVNVSAETYGDLTYTVSNGEVTITDCSTSATSVTIPAEIDGYSVSVIGDDSFYNCTELTSIEIPDSVTIIGTGVFEDCISLINVEIPDSVTTIGNCAFRECTGLTSIKIPESVTSISSGAFYMCSGLTSVEFPDGITTINSDAFYCCIGLTNIEIPDSVTSIDSGAFASCDGLTSIEIPDSIKTIGESAFYDCNELTEVIIGGNVTSWGADVFDYCSNLSKVTFKEGITRLDVNPIQSMTALETIVIPESVIEIEPNTFAYCSKLRTVIYAGSESEWNEMYMGSGNENLTSAWIDFRNEIQVRLNGEIVLFDTYPEINNGRTMVPLRAIFEALDATVDWNGETRTVVSYKGGKIVSFAIDSNIMYVNGVPVELDSPAYIKDGRTLVPVRAVSEAFDINVDWNGETRTVNLTN